MRAKGTADPRNSGGLRGERRRALGEAEGDQQTAAGGEGAWRLWQAGTGGASRPGAAPGGDPIGETEDRLVPRVAPEQQRHQQEQQRHDGKQEGAELGQGGPG